MDVLEIGFLIDIVQIRPITITTFVPSPDRDECLQLRISDFHIGETPVRSPAIVLLQLVVRVQDFDFEGILVQSGEPECRVSAEVRVDVLNIKTAVAGPVF